VRSTSEEFPLPFGVLTELAVDASRCTFEVKDGYAVIRTPQNPGYYNGNYLYFPHAPEHGDLALWLELFEQAFAADARVKHASFCWDGAAGTGAAGDFVAAGFTLDEYLVMTAETLNDFAPPAGVHLRALCEERDWAQQLAMQLDDVPAEHAGPAYAAFKAAQVEHHRAISETLGVWLGAFEGEQLVGSCGIFPAQDGRARYQDVMVAKAHRNRGIARALITAAGRWAFARFGAKTLVIVADANDFPQAIYRRAGFTEAQREARLWKANRILGF
jgi:RimJ/RimL family protein N-acetyltransferase